MRRSISLAASPRASLLDDLNLALDVINSVGPGGYFLDHEHTYHNFRQSLWHPTKTWNRDNYDGWPLASGAKDFEKGARLP